MQMVQAAVEVRGAEVSTAVTLPTTMMARTTQETGEELAGDEPAWQRKKSRRERELSELPPFTTRSRNRLSFDNLPWW